MNTNDRPPSSEALRSTAIPIANLSTEVERFPEKSIHAVVTLLWPYSSSTRSLSLLLAEPDFRLRRSNGQVRVLCYGDVAKAVARSHVGIGDKVFLSLAGSRLVENKAVAQTPGSRSAWELHFDSSTFFEVWRDSKLLSVVQVDRSSSPPTPDNLPATPTTPVTNGNTHMNAPLGSISWQSPAFLERSRKSFGLADTAFDPFAQEDGYVPGKGRKRPRFSMRSNEWRIINEPESPAEKDLPDWTVIFDEELAAASDADEESIAQSQHPRESGGSPRPEAVASGSPSAYADVAMVDFQPSIPGPEIEQANDRITDNVDFLRPDNASRSVPELTTQSESGELTHLPTDTPRLHPILSPGLPDPSPLVTSNSPSGYFAPVVEPDAAVQPTTLLVSASEVTSEPGEAITPQIQSDGEAVHVDEDDAVTVYTDDVQVVPDSITPSGRTFSSSQMSSNRDFTSASLAEQEQDEPMEQIQPRADTDFKAATTPVVYSAKSDTGSGRQIRNEEGEVAEVEYRSSDKREIPEREEQLSEHQSPVSEAESDRISDTKREIEEYDVDEEEVGALEDERADLTQSGSLTSKGTGDLSEESGHLSEYDAEEGEEDDAEDEDDYEVGSIEEGAGFLDEHEYGSEYEEDYDEEEREDKPQYEYYASGSEIESDYEEEPRPHSAPKSAEPEIIVLDSDSEDELSAHRPDDMTRREKEEDSGGPYDSDEQDDPEQEIYDEPDLVDDFKDDDEDADDMEDLEEPVQDEANQDDEGTEEHRLGSESMENNRSSIYERSTEERGSAHEQSNEGLDGDQPAEAPHQIIYDRSNVETEAPSARLPDHIEQMPTLDESTARFEYFEDSHAMPDHPHDSLGYLAAISESAERIETVSEAVQQVYEMAIDPSLYVIGTTQAEHAVETSSDGRHSVNPIEASDRAPESPENKRARNLALQLDGASPAFFAESANAVDAVRPVPIGTAAEQLATPGPSQLFEVVEFPTFVEPRDPVLPTLDLTQTTSIIRPSVETPVSPPATNSILVSEEGSPSLAVPVKVENTSDGLEQEPESEPEAPMVMVDAPESILSDEDQKLQASIEVDHDMEAGIDATHLSPVDRYYPGLRSKLSYFAPLATLIDHYNTLVDTISIASEVQSAIKAASGKKDFILTLQLTDPSMAGTAIYAQILRPYKSALPSLQEGDAILLRNFRVKSFNHSVILVSDSISAWAVYSASSDDPEVAGPPAELGDEEKTFATDLRQWYLEGGSAMVADNQLQASIGRESREGTPDSSIALSDAGDMDMALREVRGDTSSSRGSRRRKSHRRITIHELRDGRRYTEVGSSPGEGSIHELRDGTVYANL
ncbi:hypothetical protein BJX64DRAFT_288254 [Aspergillus heterothallicus]